MQLLDNETSGLRPLLRLAEEKRDDLARWYRLFCRIDDGLLQVRVPTMWFTACERLLQVP